MLPVGSNFDMLLTFVRVDGQWLKVCGQMDMKLADEIADALVQLEPLLESGVGLPHPIDIHVHEKCLAKFQEDGKWYRASITSLSKIASGKVEVTFLDYGNTEAVAMTDIRKMEDSTLMNHPPLANEFIVNCISSVGETWSAETLDFVRENLFYEVVSAHVVGSQNAIPKIEIYCSAFGNTSLANLLQERGFAKVQKDYPVIELTSGLKCEVYVSHIESLSKFWIQLVANESKLNDWMAEVEAYATTSHAKPCSSILVGQPCITTFSEDGAFYRASVLQKTNDQPLVTFVDFGNSEMKMVSEILHIPDNLIAFPAQAVECSLNGSERLRTTEDMITSFTEFTLSKTLTCTIISKTGVKTYIVNLEENGVNLFTLLTISLVPEFVPALKYDKLVFSVAEGYEIKVCHIETAGHFYCNVATQQTQIDDLMDRLEELMSIGSQPVDLSVCVPGFPCCVKYSADDMWYRAEVVESFGDRKIKVHYVDYGNSEIVILDRVRKLPTNFVRALPAQAVECYLTNAEDLTVLSADVLDEMTEGKVLVVKVNNVQNDSMVVDLFDMNCNPFLCINEVLKEKVSLSSAYSSFPLVTVPAPILNTIEKLYILVVDEAGNFFGQLDKFDLEELEMFQSQLTEYYATHTSNCIYDGNGTHVGEYCCAQFTEDEQFYRGRILNEDSENSRAAVFFVDYGNSEVKNKSDIKQLVSQFSAKEQQGILCRLQDYTLSSGMLSSALSESSVEVLITSEAIHDVYSVSLTDSVVNKDTIEKLIALSDVERVKDANLSMRSYTKPPLMREEEVCVTHCSNPGSIMCQLQRSQEVLLSLMEEIDLFGKSLGITEGCLTSLTIGSPCLARYVDDTWYRAQITSAVSSTKIIVKYVDFGNSEEVDISAVKAIPDTFMVLPRQCVECALAGVPNQTDWSSEGLAELERVALDQNLIALFECDTLNASEPYKTELLDQERHNVVTKMSIPLRAHSVYLPHVTAAGPSKKDAETFQRRNNGIGSTKLPKNPVEVVLSFKDGVQGLESNGQHFALEDTTGSLHDRTEPTSNGWDKHTNRAFTGFGNHKRLNSKEEISTDPGFGVSKKLTFEGSDVSLKPMQGNFHGSFGNRFQGSESVTASVLTDDGDWNAVSSCDFESNNGNRPTPGFGKGLRNEGDVKNCGAVKTGFGNKTSGISAQKSFAGLSHVSIEANLNEQLRRPVNASIVSTSMNVKKSGPFYTMELEKGQFKDISVVHIVSPTEFYVHLVELSGKLQMLMDSIAKRYQFSGTNEMCAHNLRTNMPCCAKYHEDNMWYRAKVLSIHGESVEVLFVDYGNSEFVPLANVKELQSEFLDFPAQALHCALENTRPIGDSWSHDDVEQFRNLTYDKCFVAYVVNHLPNGTIEMKLIEPRLLDEIDISRELVSMGHGRFALLPSTHGRVATTTYVEPVIENGAQEETLMAWLVSPNEFYCHLAACKTGLDSLMERMQRFFQGSEGSGLVITNWQVNSPCVAKFTEDDVWYRALLQEISEDSVTVFYVDFGNKERLPRSRIRANVPEFMALPTQAVKCSLRDVKPFGEDWKSTLRPTFEQHFGSKGTCTFYANFKGCYLVDLLVDGNSVATQLIRDGLAVINSRPSSFGSASSSDRASMTIADYVSPFSPCNLSWSPGEYLDVLISGGDTTDCFWCQLVSEKEVCPSLAMQLKAAYDYLSPTDLKFANPTKGTACVVKSQRFSNWLRAVVDSRPTPSKVHVFLVDIGEFEDTPLKKCKIIKEDLLTIPAEAFCCSLHGVPKDANSSLLADSFMTDCIGKEFVAQLVAKNDRNVYEVKLFSVGEDEVEIDVVDLMMEKHGSIKKELPTHVKSDEGSKVNENSQTVITFCQTNEVLEEFDEVKPENLQVLRTFSDPSTLTEQYPERCIRLHEKFSGVVVHIGSPGLFWIQVAEDEDKLTSLSTALSEQYSCGKGMMLALNELQSGTPCVAQYAEDECWYRGTILAVEEEAVHIHFVDYGNSDSVVPAVVCRPTPELLTITTLALQCELANVASKEEDWTAEAIEEFETLVMDKTLTVEVIKQEGRKYHVRLLDMGLDVATSLANKGFTTLDILSPLLITANPVNSEETVVSESTVIGEANEVSPELVTELLVASTIAALAHTPALIPTFTGNDEESGDGINKSSGSADQNCTEENCVGEICPEMCANSIHGEQTESVALEEFHQLDGIENPNDEHKTTADKLYTFQESCGEIKEIELQGSITSEVGNSHMVNADNCHRFNVLTSSPNSQGDGETLFATLGVGDIAKESDGDSSIDDSFSYLVGEASLAISDNLTITSSSFELILPQQLSCKADVEGNSVAPIAGYVVDIPTGDGKILTDGVIDSSDSYEADSSTDKTEASVLAEVNNCDTTQPFGMTGLAENELDEVESLHSEVQDPSLHEEKITNVAFDGSGFLGSSESVGENQSLIIPSTCDGVTQNPVYMTAAPFATLADDLEHVMMFPRGSLTANVQPLVAQEEISSPVYLLQGNYTDDLSSLEIPESEGTEQSSVADSTELNDECDKVPTVSEVTSLFDGCCSSNIDSSVDQPEVPSPSSSILESTITEPQVLTQHDHLEK